MNEEVTRRFQDAIRQLGLTKESEAIIPSSLSSLDDRAQEQIETAQGSAVEESKIHSERETHKVTLINIFQHPDAHPYVLDLLLLQKYGVEWMEWEPEVLRARIEQDFPTRGVSDLAISKLSAMKTLHYVGTYWRDWEVFLACTMPLNSLFPDFVMMQVPTVAQCAVSVETANRVRDDVQWSDELKTYLSTVCKFDGIFCPPEPLDFVHVDASEYIVDCDEVQKRWPDVRRTGKVQDGPGVVEEQLRRMLIVYQALLENREHLRQQLTTLLHA